MAENKGIFPSWIKWIDYWMDVSLDWMDGSTLDEHKVWIYFICDKSKVLASKYGRCKQLPDNVHRLNKKIRNIKYCKKYQISSEISINLQIHVFV